MTGFGSHPASKNMQPANRKTPGRYPFHRLFPIRFPLHSSQVEFQGRGLPRWDKRKVHPRPVLALQEVHVIVVEIDEPRVRLPNVDPERVNAFELFLH